MSTGGGDLRWQKLSNGGRNSEAELLLGVRGYHGWIAELEARPREIGFGDRVPQRPKPWGECQPSPSKPQIAVPIPGGTAGWFHH